MAVPDLARALDRRHERLLRTILHHLIYAQDNGLPGARLHLEACVRTAMRISLDKDTTGLAAYALVVKLFNACQPHFVESDETENVRRQLAVRVITFRLFKGVNAFQFQCANLPGALLFELTRDPRKLSIRFLRLPEARGERAAVHFDN